MTALVLTIAGVFGAICLAFALACLDPIWGRRTSLRDGLSALLDRDGAQEGEG